MKLSIFNKMQTTEWCHSARHCEKTCDNLC